MERDAVFSGAIGLCFALLALLVAPAHAWTEPQAVVEGGYPTIAQDGGGTYWLLFNNNSGLYLMHSEDLENWSTPSKLPFSRQNDYDPYMRIVDGRFYIAFTRHEIVNPHSFSPYDYDIYLAEKEVEERAEVVEKEGWELQEIAVDNQTLQWYPYIMAPGVYSGWCTAKMTGAARAQR